MNNLVQMSMARYYEFEETPFKIFLDPGKFVPMPPKDHHDTCEYVSYGVRYSNGKSILDVCPECRKIGFLRKIPKLPETSKRIVYSSFALNNVFSYLNLNLDIINMTNLCKVISGNKDVNNPRLKAEAYEIC